MVHRCPSASCPPRNLRLEYLELYLIHWPVSLKPGKPELVVKKEAVLAMDFGSVWEAMEECHPLGLSKSIGVSNFSCKKLDLLLSTAKIPPAANQVEMHPIWQQKKLRDYCQLKGILVYAYSPLGAKGTFWGGNKVMDSQVLQRIADRKGKTIAQVCLRWVYQQKVPLLVKSYNKERMKQNLEIFDWELSEDELQEIEELPQPRLVDGLVCNFASENGPYKSLEVLWDGEV